MKIAIAQFKPKLGKVKENLERIEIFIDEAINKKSELIIFPELATSGYALRDLVSYASINLQNKDLSNIIQKSNFIDIVLGYSQKEDNLYYNSAVYLSDGLILTNRKKVYLPDYGMFEEARYFAKGDTLETTQTKFGKVNILICEEAFHLSVHHFVEQSKSDLTIIISASPYWIYENKADKTKIWDNICNNISSLSGNFVIYVNRVGFEDGVGFFGSSLVYNSFGECIFKGDFLKENLYILDLELSDIAHAKEFMPLLKDKSYGSI
ncbi:nitrilase-related carbon-nitrogen hydrolase [Desulfurella sp.]|uniref:nitrilase-related carbon-nitrogen hydrolase n=1 Tax=Desulfurella sp. TaxID=1962857 RepID=UPI0025C6F852|nr:nitrilase-related carbon-nitrogen hydrolase [Desulfurella sp.]